MLVRNLKTRHLSMIALGGAIGTGIFLGSGYALHVAGPGGALTAYCLIAIMVYFLMTSLGEMATYHPTSGSFCEYASRYVDESFGVAMSYNYWFNWAITFAAEISAATIIVQYWFPTLSTLIISGTFFIVLLITNLLSVRVYGEIESVMSFVKIAVIVIFIVLCLFILIKKNQWGLQHFRVEDGPFHQGWRGLLMVFLIAGFSFQGSELIGVSAGEASDPKRSIPQAIRHVFWRLLLFYVLTTLLIGLLIPFNDPLLAQQDSVNSSAFTLVFQNYFTHKTAAYFMNAIILVAVLSAANASMYAAARTLWHMGNTKQAPGLFAYTTQHGVPTYAVLGTAAVGSIVFLSSYLGNGKLFTVLLTISALCGFISWFGIALTHYYFRRYYLRGDISQLSYKAKLFPYAPLIAMAMVLFVIIGQFYTIEGKITWLEIVKQYSALLVFAIIFVAHKVKHGHRLCHGIPSRRMADLR